MGQLASSTPYGDGGQTWRQRSAGGKTAAARWLADAEVTQVAHRLLWRRVLTEEAEADWREREREAK